MSDAWIGVDLGTQSLKAIALGDDGAVLATASTPLRSVRLDGMHEQDPADWLAGVDRVLGRVRDALPAGARVRGIAVDGTSGTLVPVDAAGRPTGAAAMYDDRRGASRLAIVEEAGAALWSRLGYRMQSSWALPRLLAMLDAGTTRVAHQTDLVTSHLAGVRTPTDVSSALKTGVDLDAVAWPRDVLDRLGVGEDVLPDVVETGAALGAVCRAAAERTGLPEGTPIVGGATDGVASQLAAGAIRPGEGGSVLGTTLVLKGVAPRRINDPTGAVYAHRAPFDGGWYPGGASSTGARAVSALLPGRDLDAVTAEAARRDGIPVAYPLIGSGERFPFVADAASGFWPADPDDLDDADVFRAIAFGVAFVERYALERMTDVGAEVRSVFASGGGSRNPWWLGVRAAVSGRDLRVPAQSEAAAGMALLAAAALGATPGDLAGTAGRVLGAGRRVDPEPIDADAVEDAYAEFRDRLRATVAA